MRPWQRGGRHDDEQKCKWPGVAFAPSSDVVAGNRAGSHEQGAYQREHAAVDMKYNVQEIVN